MPSALKSPTTVLTAFGMPLPTLRVEKPMVAVPLFFRTVKVRGGTQGGNNQVRVSARDLLHGNAGWCSIEIGRRHGGRLGGDSPGAVILKHG